MKFLLESLGMTNQCNLHCKYCDWKKDKFKVLTNEEIDTAKKNLIEMKKYIDRNYKEIGLVQYSGGEPFLYPQIIKYVLKIFNDKWIRINTNGLIMSEDQLKMFKEHGKVYIAVSLDGKDIVSNSARFNDNSVLKRILDNIDKLIEKEIPVMILCTLSKYNIDFFPEFIEFLETKYKEAIENGMFVMPTHSVTNYSKDNGVAKGECVDRFIKYIEKNIDKSILLKPLKKHYEGLCYYIKNHKRIEKCHISDWTLSMHFRKNQIINDGKFLSFGCGMRGVHELGLFNINDINELNLLTDKVNRYNLKNGISNVNKFNRFSEENDLDDNCENKCFPDWVMFDLILSGKISLDDAQNWFVLFRDRDIIEKINKYKSQINYK